MIATKTLRPLPVPRILHTCRTYAHQVYPPPPPPIRKPKNMANLDKTYDAAIIGAGPGGLTAASTLLDAGLSRICIIDRDFTAGRIHARYREVPSNTKTGLFAQWATATAAFAGIIEAQKMVRSSLRVDQEEFVFDLNAPNAFTRLLERDQEDTCPLGDAVDVARMLSDGLVADRRVKALKSRVQRVVREGDVWTLPANGVACRMVVLAQGASPRNFFPDFDQDRTGRLVRLHLDSCLQPSTLRERVPPGSKVAVVGSSHSAVLAMKNLYELGDDVSIVNFYRSPLLFAEYKEGWILYDNTGLKGIAADWARAYLQGEEGKDPRISRVHLGANGVAEREAYDAHLPGCTHIVAAVGYDKNKPPRIEINGKEAELDFDALTGSFKGIPGLYGVGIAYPETVTDPAGNVESAVGWMKFMKFCKRVAPVWAAGSDMTVRKVPRD